VLLAALVPLSRLQRLPSLKEMALHAQLTEQPLLLTAYPVLQAADILLPRAHVEITREIARRFNLLYGPTFTVPVAQVSGGTLVGTDNGQKMSKSAGNAIFLSDDADTVARKVRKMYTDPARVHAHIPGTVEGNPVFDPIRARREALAKQRGLVESTVLEGSARMQDVAADTMRAVRKAMGLDRTLTRFRRAVR
jgi:tryptophanyl-tRNA synthetase